MTQIGIQLITDIEQALALPIRNEPPGTLRIRCRQKSSRHPVYFFVRLADGIQTFFGTLNDGHIELIKRVNGEARTRKAN